MIGRTLVIPLGDGATTSPVTPSTQAIRFSLKTSDPNEAKARQAEALAYVERFFESVRTNKPVELSHRQIQALAGEFYKGWAQGPDGRGTLSVNLETNEVTSGPLDDDEEAELLAAVSQQLAEKVESGGTEYVLQTYGPVVDRMLGCRVSSGSGP